MHKQDKQIEFCLIILNNYILAQCPHHIHYEETTVYCTLTFSDNSQMTDTSEVLQICLLFLPCMFWKFVELHFLTVLHSLIRVVNRKAAYYTCIVHSLHSLHLPACSEFPSRSAPQPGLRTEEGCHHCLHCKETQGCSHPPAAVRLGHLCSLKRIYSYKISQLLLCFCFGNMLLFWHCVKYFILV